MLGRGCGLTLVVNGEPWGALEQGKDMSRFMCCPKRKHVENGVIVGDRVEIAGTVRRVAMQSG